jgi:molybdenum cofactor cytidylyltransferase
MRLAEALELKRGEIVAFVGAGGKTSALLQLGRELRSQRWRVLASTTTRIAATELALFPAQVAGHQVQSGRQLSQLLTEHGLVFLYDHLSGGKAIGFEPQALSQLADQVDSDILLIEADGSRRLPFKAPKSHEPVLPEDVSQVVLVAGWDALGQALDETHLYNAEAMQKHLELSPGARLTMEGMARVLRDQHLGLKGIPHPARISLLLNKIPPGPAARWQARHLAALCLKQTRISRVLLGQVQTAERPVWESQKRVVAVVLAAGLSSRMGQSKPLLRWGEKTIIENLIGRLNPLPLSDLVVVTGHRADEVEPLVIHAGARPLRNPDYAQGEMLSSVQLGLAALPAHISAALIILADQPQLSPKLVLRLMAAYAEGAGRIVAPSYQGQRGHPVLIDRRFWGEIASLGPGQAPRHVLEAYPDEVALIPWQDSSLLYDLDTPEDYQAALKHYGLAE